MHGDGANNNTNQNTIHQNRHILSRDVYGTEMAQRARQQAKVGRVPLQSLSSKNGHSLSTKAKITAGKNTILTEISQPTKPTLPTKLSDQPKTPLITFYEDSDLQVVPKNVDDIDENWSLQHANGMDTVKENYFYLLYQEQVKPLSSQFPYNPANLSEGTRLVDAKMRMTLLDWAMTCCEKLQLNALTMYQGVWILDRFIDECNSPKLRTEGRLIDSDFRVNKANLQLVGICSFVIASKYEELEYPMLDDWVFLSADSCSKKDIMGMELNILKALDFDVSTPSPIQFLRRFGHIVNVDQEVYTIAKFFLETTIYCCELSKVKFSEKALACLLIAGKLREKNFWNSDLQYYSQSRKEELLGVIASVSKLVIKITCDVLNKQNKKCKTISVFKKYSKDSNFGVANKPDVVGFKIRGRTDLSRNETTADDHIKQMAPNCIVRINPVLNHISNNTNNFF
jgi:hypothetical protein